MRTLLLCVARFYPIPCLAFATSSAAEVTQPVPGFFQCAMQAGMHNREDIGPFASGNILAGRIHLVEEKTGTKWPGVAGLFFELEGTTSAGVQVDVHPEDAKHVYVVATYHHRHGWRQIPIARYPRDAWVPVKAEVDDSGNLIVSSGKFSQRVKIGRRTISRRVVHCQSGSFDLDLRTSDGEPPVPRLP